MREAGLDEGVLALLCVGIHEREPVGGARSWKSFDRAAVERLTARTRSFDRLFETDVDDGVEARFFGGVPARDVVFG